MMDLGKARHEALTKLIEFRTAEPTIEKFVLNQDLWGMLRVIAWLAPGADEERIKERISESLVSCGRFWEREVWIANEKTSYAGKCVYSKAWDEGFEVPEDERIRIDDRTRTRTAWLPKFREPLWNAQNGWGRNRAYAEIREDEAPVASGPPIVVFYSFKGGVGRTTMLSAFAIRRARAGERVLVIDMDVDAPGAGMLLGPDEGSTERGIVDYLLEGAIGDVDIADDVHRNRRPQLVGDDGGEIIVLSAGTLNVGTNSIQSQLGLTQVLRNLGIQRLDRGDSQANCLVMHAMVVDNADVENIAREKFQEWLDETMERHYFIAEDQPEDDDWSVRDRGTKDAPDQAIVVPYRQRFAYFSKIEDVVNEPLSGPPEELDRRVCLQFPVAE